MEQTERRARTRTVADGPAQSGKYVLYLMTSSRRTRRNHALDQAAAWCKELDLPLLVVETLRVDDPHVSARTHRFVLDGMQGNRKDAESNGVRYVPFVESAPGEVDTLVTGLAAAAAVVVIDDGPNADARIEEALSGLEGRVEAVDSIGLMPVRSTDRVFKTAQSFRRHLQGELPDTLGELPSANPLRAAGARGKASLPKGVKAPAFDDVDLESLPVDHDVPPESRTGGRRAGLDRFKAFMADGLERYGERGELTEPSHSGLSPYLHFGQVAVEDLLIMIARAYDWRPDMVAAKPTGARAGWWGLPEPVETFLDELVTWRELSFNGAVHMPDYRSASSLPDWALETLREHEDDPREYVYTREQFEAADTHDELWNAAQGQLTRDGVIHSYVRMVWGKKILEWTESVEDALEIMIYLNDKYATDGRDPCSYSGIFWVAGRYDRPWGPERPVIGKTRPMSSDQTAKKFRTRQYVERYAGVATSAK